MIKIILSTISIQMITILVGIILSLTLFDLLEKFGKIGNILRQVFNFSLPLMLGCIVAFVIKIYSDNSNDLILNSIIAGIILFLFALSSYLIAVQQWSLTDDIESKLILEKTLLPNLISNIGTILFYIAFLLLPILTVNPFSNLIFDSIEWVCNHETLMYIIVIVASIAWVPFVKQGLKNFSIILNYYKR